MKNQTSFERSDNQSPNFVQTAAVTQIRQVCDILASAFSNDPLMTWMSGHPEIYSTMFYAEAKPLYFRKGKAFINGDGTGAALWAPPEISAEAPFHWSTLVMLWQMFTTGGFRSIKRGSILEKVMKSHHISEPHYYLFAIGSAQGQQGRGIGSALLSHGLEMVDQNPQPVYLESTNVRNNPLYRRFGFEIINEIQLPDNGPKIWPMLRAAQQ